MADFSQLPSMALSIDTVVKLAFYFVTGVYVIFTAILYYHWDAYATDVKVTKLTLGIYFATTLPLLLAMGVVAFIL